MTDINPKSANFIQDAVAEDLREGRFDHVRTRLPPEPNGYLHIGHAKAFLIDYTIARDFGGELDLRFDDTNPTREETEYVDAIQEDARWLGIEWKHVLFSSDFFDLLYDWAVKLVKKGRAYVDDQSPEEVSRNRGKWTEPGINSPFRNRSIEENLDLFERMKKGEFPDGQRTLRARIDMSHGNMNMRDPIMYRILHEPPHHRTGSKWCIYPTYDWAQGQNDAMHGVTHSLCSIEYEDHRPLYEWFLKELEIENPPRQIEFARLNLSHTVLSKRKLRRLVEEKLVDGWDSPLMPTLRGMRRLGYTPQGIRNFIERVGVSKTITSSSGVTVDISLLEGSIRDDLNRSTLRRLAVLDPLKVVIDNYPPDLVEELEAVNNPEDAAAGTRKVPFSRVIYIEKEDFREQATPNFFRLIPGREVRLRYAYFIRCESVLKDSQGNLLEVHCTYDPATRGGNPPDGRKVKATIHWVSAAHAVPAEVRIYNRLFNVPDPESSADFIADINPSAIQVLSHCLLEPCLAAALPGEKYQFERMGYFCVDQESQSGRLVFNRTVSLKGEWVEKKI